MDITKELPTTFKHNKITYMIFAKSETNTRIVTLAASGSEALSPSFTVLVFRREKVTGHRRGAPKYNGFSHFWRMPGNSEWGKYGFGPFDYIGEAQEAFERESDKYKKRYGVNGHEASY